MGIKIFVGMIIAFFILALPLVNADIDIFDNLNGTGYNATFENFFGKFIGNGSQLFGLTESQIIDLQHTTDTNRSDAEINSLIDNRVIQSYIEALGFVVGAHTIDTNRSDADILNVASIYNETDWVLAQNYLISETDPIFTSENSSIWNAINNKLESTDQRYNETDFIEAVNTTSNIEGLGFVTGAHTIDTNRSDSEINTLIDNRVIQSYIEALGFVTGAHTIDTNRSDADILSVASVYNDTAAIDLKLDKTDQRYNETNWVISQGYLTSETDPNLWTSAFNNTGDDRWLDDTTIGNCSGDGSCSLITYDSETTNWDKNNTDDFSGSWNDLSSVPSGFSDDIDNDTQYTHLSNFSDNIGVSADWDEIGDVPTASPSDGDTANLSTADQIYNWVIGLGYITDGNTGWDNTYGFITNSVNDLVNYYLKSEVYNKTEIYNKSEIDTQGEMEIIWGVNLATDSELAAQDECSEITGCVVGAITDGNTNWDNTYGFITNTVNDLVNYYLKTDLYNKSEIYNKTEVDNSLANQDECSEITGCVVGAITDGNTGWDNTYGFITDANDSVDSSELDNLCSTNDKILKRVSGTWQCADDQTGGGGGGNPFDQSLNTTDNVTFNKINANDWTNITITESQISDLQHTVDTNRSDQDILDVASVYNETYLINNSWNQGLADTLYMDINQDDWVDISGDSMSGSLTFTQAAANILHNFEVDIFPWGQSTTGLRISNDSTNLILQALGSSNININDDLSVKGIDVGTWLYNQTEPANQYTDSQISSVNTTANIESLGFTQGPHTTDTNESARFGNLVNADCSGTDKVIGVQSNGTVLCGADQDSGASYPHDQDLNTTDDVTFNKVTHTTNSTGSGTVNSWLDKWRGITSLAASSFFFDGTGSYPRWYFRDDGVGFLQIGLDDVRVYGGANFTAENSVRFNSLTTCTALETDGSGYIGCGTDDVNDADADATNELQNLWSQFSADSGSTTANSQTDVLTVSGSGSVSTSISGDTLTISGTDSDTTYTNGSGVSLVGTQFNHTDTSSQASSDNSGRIYIQDIILDGFGHITSIVTATETVVDTTSFFIDTDAEASTEINEGETVLLSDSTGMSVTRSGNTISFSTTLGTAIEKGEISNSGTLNFDWIDDEIADTLTIGSSSTVADGALSSNVPLKNAANDFSQEQTFSAGVNVTSTNQLKIGACYEQWNGTCLNTYCSGTLIQSIGCA